MKYDVNLRPIHYASVSGGKDSFYMLNLILQNPEKYPLDMVVHFELEIDWIWAKEVIDFMEQRCVAVGIKFVRIKPRKTFQELYEKYDIPTRNARWCNSDYKLDCKKQLNEWILQQNCRPLAYIGFCADETKRFKYELGEWENQECCYPLAEEGITEDVILEWAKTQPIFQGWYKHFKRQGCMICPQLSRKEMAYLSLHYPDVWDKWIEMIRKYEERFNTNLFGEPIDRLDRRIEEKWIPILVNEDLYEQANIFDYLE